MELKQIMEGVEGWCTLHKASVLHGLASAPDCRLAVEVGIYGGKSLLPVAAAFAAKGEGRIYGIEPWDNAIAVETITDEGNDKWWSEIDLLAIKRSFFRRVAELKFEKYIRVLEIPSDAAIPVFQSPRYAGHINLVHVDGAHSVEQSVFACAYWLRLLHTGGHLPLDDINWPSVHLALDYMKSVATLVDSVDNDSDGHFAVFKKR